MLHSLVDSAEVQENQLAAPERTVHQKILPKMQNADCNG